MYCEYFVKLNNAQIIMLISDLSHLKGTQTMCLNSSAEMPLIQRFFRKIFLACRVISGILENPLLIKMQ